jgi:hypothetical protein
MRKPDVTVSNRGRISEIVLSCKNSNIDTIVFPVGSIDKPQYGANSVPPSPAELSLVTRLAQWSKDNMDQFYTSSTALPAIPQKTPVQVSNRPSSTPGGTFLRPVHKKFSLLANVADRGYFVIFGEVVKIFKRDGLLTELYVTDYTTNNLFFDYKDKEADNNGVWDPNYRNENNQASECPKGRITICITLWQPHSEWANQNLAKGDIVRINNMHVKYENGYLEGVCHTDSRYPEKVDVSVIPANNTTFGELPGLLGRREKYQAALLAPAGNEGKAAKRRAAKQKKEKEKKQEEEKRRLAKENERTLPAKPNNTVTKSGPVQTSNGLNANSRSKIRYFIA